MEKVNDKPKTVLYVRGTALVIASTANKKKNSESDKSQETEQPRRGWGNEQSKTHSSRANTAELMFLWQRLIGHPLTCAETNDCLERYSYLAIRSGRTCNVTLYNKKRILVN